MVVAFVSETDFLLKENIRFVPNNLKLKWYVTKHEEDLKQRQRFDVQYLKGSYMICVVGPSCKLKLIDMQANEGALEKTTGGETNFERKKKKKKEELAQIKKLNSLLRGPSSGRIDVGKLLNKAENQIKELESLYAQQCEICEILGSRRFELGSRLIQLLDSFDVDDADKMTWLNRVKKLYYAKESNEFVKHFKQALLRCKFGRLYLILNGEQELLDAGNKTTRRRKTETKKTKPDSNRRKKSFPDLPQSVTDTPVTMKSGGRREEGSKAAEAAKEKGQETSTVAPIENPAVAEIVVIDTSILLVSNQANTNSQNENTRRNLHSLALNTDANTHTTRRQMPKFDTILFLPLTSSSRRTSNSQQSSSRSELVPVPEITARQPPVSTSSHLREQPNVDSSNTEIETLSESLVVMPPLEQNRFVITEPISLESTTTSSEIHIPNNPADDANGESNEIMVFDPDWGCFVTFGLEQ